MMSMHRALRDIMKMSDADIKDMLNEIRLEKAMAAELQATANVIKKTGIFDTVDRIYGDYDAMNSDQPAQPQGEGEDGMGGGGGGLGGLGGGMDDLGGDMDMDMGEPGGDMGGDLGGTPGETDMGGAPSADAGEPLMESSIGKKKPLSEVKKSAAKSFTQQYFSMLSEAKDEDFGENDEPFDFDGKNVTLEMKLKETLDKFENLVNEDSLKREEMISEAVDDLETISGSSEDHQEESPSIGIEDEDLE